MNSSANQNQLRDLLLRIDRQSYRAYKAIQGTYSFPGFTLIIDHVQGDPFAAPSRLRAIVPQSVAQFPEALFRSTSRAIALRDFLTRRFAAAAENLRAKRGSGNSGLIAIAPVGQHILERTAVLVSPVQVEARFVVGLPAQGRSVLGRQAAELLCEDLLLIVEQSLKYRSLDPSALVQHVAVAEDADWLRSQLSPQNLVAFIPDGAILPRQSGVSDEPLGQGALPFRSPEPLRVEFDRPNQGPIQGMGIPRGVTLIVGGGYHGKSTLLRAIAGGIYNHIPGDGREQLVTDLGAVKIRAEDGRSVAGVNLSPFINHLPQGRSTLHFSTPNASGSTSQAASIMEALEAGATTLLVDEDTAATNFMIRDRRMQALIAKHQEPITPFIDKIRQLYREYGVSTVLVMGGSGDYFDVADTVIAMTEFEPGEVTQQARAIAAEFTTGRAAEGGDRFGDITPRIPRVTRLEGQPRRGKWGDAPEEQRAERTPKLKVRDVDELVFGGETVDLSAVEQLVEAGQVRAIGGAIAYLQQHYLDGRTPLNTILDWVVQDYQKASLDIFTAYPQGDLVAFRGLELAAAVNRLRSLIIGTGGKDKGG